MVTKTLRPLNTHHSFLFTILITSLSLSLSLFNMAEDVPEKGKNRFSFKPPQRPPVDYVGLRILIEISQGKSNFLVVKKPTLKLKTKPTFPTNRIHPLPSFSHESNSFLKSCFLCTKELSLDKDVYMYK